MAQEARMATQRSQRWRMTAPAEFFERAIPAPCTAKPTRIKSAPSAPMIKRKSMAGVPYTRGAGGGKTLQRRGGEGERGKGRRHVGTKGKGEPGLRWAGENARFAEVLHPG